MMVRLIASFGGFLGRKGDGEPGVKTIWTGLQRGWISPPQFALVRQERFVCNEVVLALVAPQVLPVPGGQFVAGQRLA
jgi:hypothetical protein